MVKKKYCIITNDVETTSIVNHTLSSEAGNLVLNQGLPRLLSLYKKYNVKSTFFFCGDIIQQHPGIVKMVIEDGHEVASHGWDHKSDKAFDVLSLEEQIKHLKLSKQLLEELSGKEIISFRAPALRINEDTYKALIKTGFMVDSSVSSQRMDMFFSFGSLKKLNWLIAPRLPYFTKKNKLWKKGDGLIFEIPVSAFGLAYIGTTLRIIPILTKILRYLLHFESIITGKPIVFLTHPNEYIDEQITETKTKRRSTNFIGYLFGDVLRRRLKLKNLGHKGLPLHENEIIFFHNRGYEFITCNKYFETINDNKNKN